MDKLKYLLPIAGFLGLVYMIYSIFYVDVDGFSTGALVALFSFVSYCVIDNKVDNGSDRN